MRLEEFVRFQLLIPFLVNLYRAAALRESRGWNSGPGKDLSCLRFEGRA